jgi:hypothetical protein
MKQRKKAQREKLMRGLSRPNAQLINLLQFYDKDDELTQMIGEESRTAQIAKARLLNEEVAADQGLTLPRIRHRAALRYEWPARTGAGRPAFRA